MSAERVQTVGLTLRHYFTTDGQVELGFAVGSLVQLIDIVVSHDVWSRRCTNEHVACNSSGTIGSGNVRFGHIDTLSCHTREDDTLAGSNIAIGDLFDDEALVIV